MPKNAPPASRQKTCSKAACALLLMLAANPGMAMAQPDFPTMWDAFAKLGLSLYSAAISYGNLQDMYKDPTFNAVVLAASTEDVFAAVQDFNAGVGVQNVTLARAAAMFLVIPQPKNTTWARLQPTDGLTLDTLLTKEGSAEVVNHTVTTLTFRGSDDGPYWFGGSPPGGLLYLNDSYTAGRGRLYITKGFAVPPSTVITTPSSPAYVFSIEEQLALHSADKELMKYARDPNSAFTFFAPTNASISKYLSGNGTSFEDFVGSPAARDLLLGHFLAARPYMISQFPTAGLLPFEDLLGRTVLVAVGTVGDNSAPVSVAGPYNQDPARVMPAPMRNLRGGKSVVHAIFDGVIQPGLPPPVILNPQLSPTPQPAQGSQSPMQSVQRPAKADGGGGSDQRVLAAVVVAAVGGSLLLIISVGITLYMVHQRLAGSRGRMAIVRAALAHEAAQKHGDVQSVNTDTEYNGTDHKITRARTGAMSQTGSMRHGPPALVIPGVPRGIFVKHTAMEYSWASYIPKPGESVAVEAGVNDMLLDEKLKTDNTRYGGVSPVMRLTKEQLVNEVKLLRNGLLGKGATALVFQCLWPSRFGPDALLAIKVLRDGMDADPHHRESFVYEASVLTSVQHPNIVKCYGYCLESPTVCIIMELLPTSLRSLLYPMPLGPNVASLRPSTSSIRTRTHTNPLPMSPPATAKAPLLLQHTSSSFQSMYEPSSSLQQPSGSNQQDGTSSALARSSALAQSFTQGVRSAHSAQTSTLQRGQSFTQPNATEGALSPSLQHGSQIQHAASNASACNTEHSMGIVPAMMTTTGTCEISSADVAPPLPTKKLNMHQVLSISTDIAAGLAHLHLGLGVKEDANKGSASRARRVVHRDLKPANILINSQGTAKISDFGLARQHHQTTIATKHLGAGTLPYMAPELLFTANTGPAQLVTATNRVDIYSLSMICWEMLAGHPPWQGLPDALLLAAVTKGERPPLPDVSPPILPTTLTPPTSGELQPQPPGPDPAILQAEASLEVLPEFNAIIRACWRQREGRRPNASVVHAELFNLFNAFGPPTHRPAAYSSSAGTSCGVTFESSSGGGSSGLQLQPPQSSLQRTRSEPVNSVVLEMPAIVSNQLHINEHNRQAERSQMELEMPAVVSNQLHINEHDRQADRSQMDVEAGIVVAFGKQDGP